MKQCRLTKVLTILAVATSVALIAPKAQAFTSFDTPEANLTGATSLARTVAMFDLLDSSRSSAAARVLTEPFAGAQATTAVSDFTTNVLELSEASLIGLQGSETLVFFNAADTATTTSLTVTGLLPTSAGTPEALIGIDFRPENGLLYGITLEDSVYTIDPTTGAATLVSTLAIAFPGGSASGVDFNPVADRLRLVSRAGDNFRVNVDTGETFEDTPYAYVDGTDTTPFVSGVAYTNSLATATSTQLYGIDYEQDSLVLVSNPNAGEVSTVGLLGPLEEDEDGEPVKTVDFGQFIGFDILSDFDGDNLAFALTGSDLYTIDLSTGLATSVGTVGDGSFDFVGLAAVPIPEPSTGTLMGFGALALFSRLRKRSHAK